eukprot:c25253_g1_i1.p1 GENE.c25253_g1_i1~~c25253_g1_i1.p1  ORF type:complete len:905 (-),score=209.27 c25253_g1_i1:120-2834(-)
MNRQISVLSRDESFRSIVVVTPEASQLALDFAEPRHSLLQTEPVLMDIHKYIANHRHVRMHSMEEFDHRISEHEESSTLRSLDAGSNLNEFVNLSPHSKDTSYASTKSEQISFFGDFKLFRDQRFSAHKSVRYIFNKADLIVGNIEMIVTALPMSAEEANKRSPIRLKSRDVRRIVDRATVDRALHELGVDPSKCLFSVANNHAGLFDLENTVDILQSMGAVVMGHVAGGMLTKILVGTTYVGFVAWTKSLGKNRQAAVWTQEDIESVDWKKVKLDMQLTTLIAFPHWDGRRNQLPARDRTKIANKLFAQGFDVIVGHGSHILKPCAHLNSDLITAVNGVKVGSIDDVNDENLPPEIQVSPNQLAAKLTPEATHAGMQLCVFGLGHINSKLPSRKLGRRLGGVFTVTVEDGKIVKYVIDPIVHTLTNDNRGGASESPKASRNRPVSESKTLVAHQRVKIRQHTMVHTLESAPPMNNEIRSLDKRLQHLFPSYSVPLTGYLHGLNDLVTRQHRYSVKLFSPDEGHASVSVRLIGDQSQGVWHELQMGSGRKLFRAHHMPRFFFNERRYLGNVTHLKLLIRRSHKDEAAAATACMLTRIHVTYIGSTAPGAEYPAEQFDFPVTDDPETTNGRRMSFWGPGSRPGISLKRAEDLKVLLRMDPDKTDRPAKEDDVALLKAIDEQIMRCVKTGDCIAFSSKSRLAPYTRRMTGSPITHVGSVVVKKGQSDSHWRPVVLLYEATLNGDGTQDFAMQRSHGRRKHLGVWGFSLVERVLSYGGDAWYVPLKEDCTMSQSQQDVFASFLKRVHMDLVPYDKTQLVTQAFERLTGIEIDFRHNDISKLFCSEMVSEALRQAGIAAVHDEVTNGAVINPVWHKMAELHSSEMSPVDCCRLPIFVPEPFVKIKSYL